MNESTSLLRPLIDGDIVLYRCGFSVKEDEPVENALHNAKQLLDYLRSRFTGTPARVFLTGKGNYREQLAVTKPYKGNRDPNNKPKYYNELREYMLQVQGAELIEGMEADDAMGMAQWEAKGRDTVIVTTDKDLNMIPGYHYNWVKDILFYQTLAEADLFFYRQCLIGDSVDNVPGCPGIGPKKAEKLLPKPLSTDEMDKIVAQAYFDAYKDWSVATERYTEVRNLLWILREERAGGSVLD